MDDYFYLIITGILIFLFWRNVIRSRCCRSNQKLQQSCVIVTGCDYGFGRAIALHLHSMGTTVYAGVLSTQSGEKLLQLTNNNNDNNNKLIPVVMDVTKMQDIQKAVQIVTASKLPLLAIVNNAGISAFGWAEALPISTFEKNMNVNFFGTVRMTTSFLPLLRATQGRIINMGSIGARMPSAFGSSYLSTKAAMSSYSDCVRQEVHRFGVKVCLIEPGFFPTELLANGAKAGASNNVLKGVYPNYNEKMKATKKPIEMMEWLNGSIDKVTDCVVDGLTNKWPLARYTIGYDARIIRHFLCYLPSWVIDEVQTAQG